MQDACSLAIDTGNQAGVCPLFASLGIDGDVQQGRFRITINPADGQDMESTTPAVSALKKLALLEPDLIMPALMERAVPSLQGLEEVGSLARILELTV